MAINDARSLDQLLGEVTPNRRALSLASLFNVDKTPPADGDLFGFEAATGLWGPRTLALGDLPAIGLDDLTDVTLTSVASGDLLVHNGTAWANTQKAWIATTPVWAQGGAVTKTVNYSKYVQFGKTVLFQGFLSATGAGTANTSMTISLPVTAATNNLYVGNGKFQDTGTAVYPLEALLLTTTTLAFTFHTDLVALGGSGASFSGAIASTDAIWWNVRYEAA